MPQTKSTQTLVGIAFYEQGDLRNHARWALVLARKHYGSKRTRVYQICKDDTDDWALDYHKCQLDGMGTLIGVLHMKCSPYHIDFLDQHLQTHPAGKESMNPGQVFAWSSSAWVIRALIVMHEQNLAIIPGKFRYRNFWNVGTEYSFLLKENRSPNQEIAIVSWPTT